MNKDLKKLITKDPRVKGYQSQTCQQGHSHYSVGEAQYCNKLHFLQKAGEIRSYKNQKTYDFYVNGVKICSHRVDFVITNNDDSIEVHEYKGFATQLWYLKHRLFKALYPDIPYIVKTQRDLL